MLPSPFPGRWCPPPPPPWKSLLFFPPTSGGSFSRSCRGFPIRPTHECHTLFWNLDNKWIWIFHTFCLLFIAPCEGQSGSIQEWETKVEYPYLGYLAFSSLVCLVFPPNSGRLESSHASIVNTTVYLVCFPEENAPCRIFPPRGVLYFYSRFISIAFFPKG